MRQFLSVAAIAPILAASFALPAAAQDPEWVRTEVFITEVEQGFNQCMNTAIEAGARPTNGLLLNCTPSSDDIRDVMAGMQPVTSMTACVDWSLAAMAGIVSNEMMSQLNANTQCETEGTELSSLNDMWQWVRESEYEPYGI